MKGGSTVVGTKPRQPGEDVAEATRGGKKVAAEQAGKAGTMEIEDQQWLRAEAGVGKKGADGATDESE